MTKSRFLHGSARLGGALGLVLALSACQSLLPVGSDSRIPPVDTADRALLDWRWPYEMGRFEWDRVRHARRAVERGEYKAGLERLEELAAQGTPPAYYELAKMYHYGRGVSQDARRAEALYREAVSINSSIRDNASYNMARLYLTRPELGDHSVLAYHLLHQALEGERRAEALTWLGYLRAHGGPGVPVDVERAERLYQKAVGLGSPEALRALAEAHTPGGFLSQDDSAAQEYLTRYQEALRVLITEGDVEAMLDMARLHRPAGLLPDPEQRRVWLERAVARGNADAMRRAGEMLLSQEPTRGLTLLTRAAHRGSVPAMATIGQMYLGDDSTGRGNSSIAADAGQARYWLEKAVAQGDSNAEVDLGGAWLSGEVLNHRPREGQRLLEKAAQQGKPRAWTILGRAHLDGAGVPRRPRIGLDYLQRADAAGEISATVSLGVLLLNGAMVGADPQDALISADYLIAPRPQEGEALLEKAARLGEPNAMRHLGEAYLTGERLPYRPQRAERLLQKAVAMGDDTAMASLADAWLQGTLAADNGAERAVALLKQAAGQGNGYAMVLLGRAYRQAPGGLKRDLQASEEWLRRAVQAGHPSADRALHNTLYAWGLEGNIRALKQAAEDGHPGAMEVLGERYLNGRGVARNAALAKRWLGQAAASGRYGAAWQLGRAYLTGEGLTRDATLARRYLEPLARGGHHGAGLALGRAYLHGDGLARNMAAAERYLTPLADRGDVTAARELGQAYLAGPTAFQNPARAERYLQQAIAGGDLYAHWVLGQALLKGESALGQDISRGQALLESAADAGHAGSMAMLGREYLNGEQLAYRPERGARYLMLAAKTGHLDARTSLVTAYLRANGLATHRANQRQAMLWLNGVIQSDNALALDTLYQLLVEQPPEAQQEPVPAAYLQQDDDA